MPLRRWIARALRCQSPQELKDLLAEFCQHKWTLEQKALMSGAYTPRLVKWVRDSDDKWIWIEDLAELCWRQAA